MKKQLFLFVIGVAAVLLLLETIFRILPVSTATRSGYYIHPLILTYPANHCFTAATGWDLKNAQHNCANNLGFLADHDFVHDPQAIALIGDSFVEANMLPANKRLGAQLEAKLSGKPVYALGGPGSNLLDYAERAKFAAEKFGVRTFIFILERGDIKQSICSSGNIHGPCLDAKTLLPKIEIQQPADALKRLLRESALAQYTFSQLKFNISTILSSVSQPAGVTKKTTRTVDVSLKSSSQILEYFFRQLSTIENAQFLFVVDADRPHLSDKKENNSIELKSLKNEINALNMIIIDPTAAFREFIIKSGRTLEVGNYDHHWNGETVGIIATLIANQLPLLAVKN